MNYQVIRVLSTGGHVSIMDFDDGLAAADHARDLNESYQSNEYRVRSYDDLTNTWRVLR